MKIKFRTSDDQQSTFNKLFDTFEDALNFYKQGLEPDEPCESSLDVVVLSDSGEVIQESNLFFEKWFWDNGKLVNKKFGSLF